MKKQLIGAWVQLVTVFQAIYRVVFKLVVLILQSISNSIKNSLPTWFLAIVALLSLAITYRNIELINKPFVSIEDVYWRPENVWFVSGFRMRNYGDKPAQEFSLRNVRAIILNLDKKLLVEKLKQENKDIAEQYFQEYLTDLRNKVYWETVNLLADYFYKYPVANKYEVTNFLNSWNAISFENSKLKHNGKLLVSIVEVNNDMFDYFSKSSLLVYPDQENTGRRYNQQMGTGGMEAVEKGENLLIVYWSIKYKGLIDKFLWFTPPTYSTQYIGYHLEPKITKDSMGHSCYLLRELRSWSKIEKTTKK